MYTATEVATRKHVLAAIEGGIDMIWIGARTTANPFAMQEIADALRGHDIPVLVKNPGESRPRIVDRRRGTHLQRRHPPPGCHPPRVHVDRQKPLPQPPDVVTSPSSCTAASRRCRYSATRATSAGSRELIAPLSQQAMDLGLDGLIIEAHCSPDCGMERQGAAGDAAGTGLHHAATS